MNPFGMGASDPTALLTSNSSATEVAKALGINVEVDKAFSWGNVSTDRSLGTQVWAGTKENLDYVATEYIYSQSQMNLLAQIPTAKTSSVQPYWLEVYGNGYEAISSLSDQDGMSKQNQRDVRTKHTRVKFFTQGYAINDFAVQQSGFIQALNQEDVAAYDRIYQDLATLLYTGNATFGDRTGNAENNLAGNEFDGLDRLIESPLWSNYDGKHVIDLLGSGYSGLDAAGFSNPADIEQAVIELSKNLIQPLNRGNGSAMNDKLIIDQSTHADLQAWKNFTSYQILDGKTNSIVSGKITQTLANPYSGDDGNSTRLVTDIFMPGPNNLRSVTKPAQARIKPDGTNEAQPMPAPTVTAALVAAAGGRWGGVWAGDYWYFIAPFGVRASTNKKGYEGTAVATAASLTMGGAGMVAQLTIVAAAGALEDGYAIYRSRRFGGSGTPGTGSNNPADARLVARIGRDFSGTTIWKDDNSNIPGSVSGYLVDFTNPNVLRMLSIFDPYRLGLPRNADYTANNPAVMIATAGLQSKYYRSMAKFKNYVPRNALDRWSPLV